MILAALFVTFFFELLELRVRLVGLVLVDLGIGRKPVLLYAVLNITGFSAWTCKVDIVLDGLRVFNYGNFVTVVAPIFLVYLLTSFR